MDIRRGLQSAFLLQLAPGSTYIQTSHAVLLAGVLQPAGPAAAAAAQSSQILGATSVAGPQTPFGTAAEQNVEPAILSASMGHVPVGRSKPVAAPKVLPWLWSDRQRCNTGAAAPMAVQQTWEVGPEGAVLMVCHNPDGEVPEAVQRRRRRQRRRSVLQTSPPSL